MMMTGGRRVEQHLWAWDRQSRLIKNLILNKFYMSANLFVITQQPQATVYLLGARETPIVADGVEV